MTTNDYSARLATAVQPLLSEGASEGFDVAIMLESALAEHHHSRMNVALLCAKLSQATKLGPADIGQVIAEAVPDLVHSLSWVTKLVKAGTMLLNWPQLEDIQNIDKLATLYRVPRKLQQGIFESGCLPNGTRFRELDREQLADAVRALRAETKIPVQRNIHKEARRELFRLSEAISTALAQISPHSKYAGVLAQLAAWQAELKKITEDAVIPRTGIFRAMTAPQDRPEVAP